MMAVLGAEGLERGEGLVHIYQDAEPDAVLTYVALALHLAPKRGALGPAMRDIAKRPLPDDLFGALLTDIRDFLKLRFRAKGLDIAHEDILKAQIQGGLPPDVSPYDGSGVINYAISALDALNRDRGASVDITLALQRLRDLLRETAKFLFEILYPDADGASRAGHQALMDKAFEENDAAGS